MLNSANSASNGSLSQLRQQGDFCGIAFFLLTIGQCEAYLPHNEWQKNQEILATL